MSESHTGAEELSETARFARVRSTAAFPRAAAAAVFGDVSGSICHKSITRYKRDRYVSSVRSEVRRVTLHHKTSHKAHFNN